MLPLKNKRDSTTCTLPPRWMAVIFFAALGWLAPKSTLHAQEIALERLSSELGLSQNMILCLMQDSKGFLWAGTKNGLNRFDGYGFKVYNHDFFDTTTISDGEVEKIIEDEEGRMWVATASGLDLFDAEREVFQHFSSDEANLKSIGSKKIKFLKNEGKGKIWVITDDSDILRLSIPSGSKNIAEVEVEQVQIHLPQGKINANSTVDALLPDANGAYWIVTANGFQQFTLDEDKLEFIHHDFLSQIKLPHWENALLTASQGKTAFKVSCGQHGCIWIGMKDQLGHFDAHSGSWSVYQLQQSVDWDNVHSITEDSQSSVWISGFSGVHRFDRLKGELEYWHSQNDTDHPLHYGVGPVLEDRGGVIWMGTRGTGLVKFDRKANRFAKGPQTICSQSASIRALCQTTDGRIWAAPVSGGLCSYDKETDRLNFIISTAEAPIKNVQSILEDASGKMWLGTSNGLFLAERNEAGKPKIKRRYWPIPNSPNPGDNHVWKIIEGQDAAIWLVTSTSLCRFDKEEASFDCYPLPSQRPLNEMANMYPTVFQHSNGIIWVGYSEGLLRFDPLNKEATLFQSDPSDPQSLSGSRVRSIVADPLNPEKALWLGTAGGGLNRFDIDSGGFTKFTEEDGLPDMVIYAILTDDGGHLWMSTNKGLSVFDPRLENFRNFDEKDGLQSLEFNAGAYFKSKQGQLFFGGIKGFNAFFPAGMLHINDHKPQVVITDLKIANRSVSLRDSRPPIEKSVPYAKRIVLSPQEKVISFEFAALDLSEPSKNQFAYRMEGFESEWRFLRNDHTATYTNLDPGTYRFVVKGSNCDDRWNAEGTSVEVVVLTPWWQTPWAYLLYALLFTALVFAVHRFQTARVEEREALRRNQEINAARSAFLSTVSHELRTPLTSILGFAKITKKRLEERILPATDQTSPKTERAVQQVLNNLGIVIAEGERLTVLIDEVLDLSKIEAGKVVWHQDNVDIAKVIDRALDSTANLFSEKDILLEKRVASGLPIFIADRDRLIQVVVNLLSNAAKFTDQGKVTIFARRVGDEIIVNVKDTGKGIPEAYQRQIFEKFEQVEEEASANKPKGTGLGLPICKEIIAHHDGRIWVESETGRGSTFSFSVPIK